MVRVDTSRVDDEWLSMKEALYTCSRQRNSHSSYRTYLKAPSRHTHRSSFSLTTWCVGILKIGEACHFCVWNIVEVEGDGPAKGEAPQRRRYLADQLGWVAAQLSGMVE